MPRTIATAPQQAALLEETIAALDALDPDFSQDEHLLTAATHLRALDANRTFLGDLMVEELKSSHRADPGANGYGPQAIMLSGARPGYFLRANIWPAAGDSVMRAGGASSFAYGLPHDHNFDFLTIGHFGPGYGSDYYEYDYDSVIGVTGGSVALRFRGRSILSPGEVQHYRAHRDIHAQLPPASLSVSLNVVAANPAQAWHDQYRFDLNEGRITAILNPGASEALLRCGIATGHQEMRDLADHFTGAHPSERLRLAIYDERSRTGEDPDAVWREAELSGSRLVAGEARQRRAALASV
ncbi:transposase [Qipengyuania sp. DSG2-2]|uniref:transposase n=1 Tax=Qipengyuania sp. DGS2-2 TaxID=3349631 RepID=UPI0036D3F7BD